jgi:hypothetical protein
MKKHVFADFTDLVDYPEAGIVQGVPPTTIRASSPERNVRNSVTESILFYVYYYVYYKVEKRRNGGAHCGR